MHRLESMKRKEKALVKDLELQIDFLCGYAPQGLHWKQEYHVRKTLIDEVLSSENTPKDIREKIYRIQESLYRLQNKEKNDQPYIQYSMDKYKPKHKVLINHFQNGKSYYIEI